MSSLKGPFAHMGSGQDVFCILQHPRTGSVEARVTLPQTITYVSRVIICHVPPAAVVVFDSGSYVCEVSGRKWGTYQDAVGAKLREYTIPGRCGTMGTRIENSVPVTGLAHSSSTASESQQDTRPLVPRG